MYERNVHSYTMREQLKLAQSSVAIVGVGGGGCIVAEILARTGVGKIRLIEGDIFEESNRNRQIGALKQTLGLLKVEVMAERLRDANSLIKVEAIPEYLTVDNYERILSNVDVVCDTADKAENKLLVSQCCQKLGRAYVTGGLGNTRCWTASFKNSEYSTRDVVSPGKSQFANTATIFIQAGLQAQEIINILLKRNWGTDGKIITFYHQTYEMRVKDIEGIQNGDIFKQQRNNNATSD